MFLPMHAYEQRYSYIRNTQPITGHSNPQDRN